jgi:hypothetical protein
MYVSLSYLEDQPGTGMCLDHCNTFTMGSTAAAAAAAADPAAMLPYCCQVCGKPCDDSFPCSACSALYYCSAKHQRLRLRLGHDAEQCSRMRQQLARSQVRCGAIARQPVVLHVSKRLQAVLTQQQEALKWEIKLSLDVLVVLAACVACRRRCCSSSCNGPLRCAAGPPALNTVLLEYRHGLCV